MFCFNVSSLCFLPDSRRGLGVIGICVMCCVLFFVFVFVFSFDDDGDCYLHVLLCFHSHRGHSSS